MLAAGLVTSAFGQIQVAGTLQVNVDATAQPVGALAYLANSGAMGGVFIASNNAAAGVTPQIIALGGNGTHGVLLDGNQTYLAHFTAANGAAQLASTAPGLVGANPKVSVEVWMYKATVNDETAPVAWGTRTTGQEVSCGWGRNATWGGLSFMSYDYSWTTVPTAGTWHHLVWVYDNTAVGTNAGTVLEYRDGVLDKSAVRGIAPNVAGAYNILLGAQHAGAMTPAANLFAAGVLGKVRIHDGVLSLSQITNNYLYEVASFTNGTPAANRRSRSRQSTGLRHLAKVGGSVEFTRRPTTGARARTLGAPAHPPATAQALKPTAACF